MRPSACGEEREKTKTGNKEAMRLPLALASLAILASACAPPQPAFPPDMPLPASLRILTVRHPALALAKVTGDRDEPPAALMRSYALALRREGWNVDLHRDRCAKTCRWVPARRIAARRGPLQIDARAYARGSSTFFTAEELRDQFFVAPRRQAKVNPAFFDERIRRVKSVELAAWQLESGKRLPEAASGLERAIALAADAQSVARKLHAYRYISAPEPLIADARLRLGYVFAKLKRRAPAFETWRKVVHANAAVVPAADAHPSRGTAWKLLQLSLAERAAGTRPTPHEFALVNVLLTGEHVDDRAPVTRSERPPAHVAPARRMQPVRPVQPAQPVRKARRHRRFLFWQWTTKT